MFIQCFYSRLTWYGLTLIDVHALSRVDILEESRLAGQGVRTLLTGVTPGNSNSGTA